MNTYTDSPAARIAAVICSAIVVALMLWDILGAAFEAGAL